MEGTTRICNEGEIQEEISDYSHERRSYRYQHVRVPLPVKRSHGTLGVEPGDSGSLIVMDTEIEALDPRQEAELIQMVDGYYKQALESLLRTPQGLSAGGGQAMTGEAAFDAIAKTLLKSAGVTQSQMFGSPGLKVGGKVFAMLYKGKLVVKLPQDRVRALVASGDGEPFDPGHGRLMREWVALGQEAKIDWLSLAKEARAFVRAGQEAVRGAARRPQKGERASRAARR